MSNHFFKKISMLVFTLALAFNLAPDSQQKANAAGTDSELVSFGPGQTVNLVDALDSEIDNATTTIDGAFYEIRYQPFVDALIRAKNRGVTIRIVTDSDYITNSFTQQLIDAGISVKGDNRSALMHNKYAIIDGKEVWMGSTNATDTCNANNFNNTILWNSSSLASIYKTDFEEMFVNNQFTKTASPSTISEQKVTVTTSTASIPVEVYFAPEDNPITAIIDVINNAKYNVYFDYFSFTDDNVRTALINAKNRGVNVEGIFDQSQYGSNGPYGEFAYLAKEGIPVSIADNPYNGKLHDKVLIADKGYTSAAVVTGSFNASANANDSNSENLMVVHDKATADKYYNEFLRIRGSYGRGSVSIDKSTVAAGSNQTVNVTLKAPSTYPIQKVDIMAPPKWPDPTAATVTAVKSDGTNVSSQLKFSGNYVYIDTANLLGNQSITFTFSNWTAPTIAGDYTWYTQTVASSAADLYDYLPVNYQAASLIVQ
ncbi:phospholipase D-like domain-containing protein [Fictibacillus barbaricus]|uniref:phospholipase D n=1 Tax=Fictibacillus barbaricus TaxID=182136 RepID=A0ABU1U0C7_9BACL|nr:phospholipase D-like domain-containing protein [Fictibacillus barbaricus]MDR7072926.1 phosphatidylserine/phosphatidylglycerophosphate/cardiolipin synthase-like enzyme [Fictibacillus barbaricus]